MVSIANPKQNIAGQLGFLFNGWLPTVKEKIFKNDVVALFVKFNEQKIRKEVGG